MSNLVVDERDPRKEFGFKFDRNEKIGNSSLNWSQFEAKNLRFSIMQQEGKLIDIVLNGGIVDGDLIIDGINQRVRSIRIIDCQVSGRISIYSTKAKKITIAANSSTVELIDCDIEELHLCSQVDDDISLVKLKNKDASIELNGYSKIVRLREVNGESLKFSNFEADLISGQRVYVNEINLPTDNSVDLRKIYSDKIRFFRNRNKIGLAYELKNAKLEF